MKNSMLILFAFLLGLSLSCGKAMSGAPSQAEPIPVIGSSTGVSCYLIRDETGKAVGGSCIKN